MQTSAVYLPPPPLFRHHYFVFTKVHISLCSMLKSTFFNLTSSLFTNILTSPRPRWKYIYIYVYIHVYIYIVFPQLSLALVKILADSMGGGLKRVKLNIKYIES